jgi:hypothetical protein
VLVRFQTPSRPFPKKRLAYKRYNLHQSTIELSPVTVSVLSIDSITSACYKDRAITWDATHVINPIPPPVLYLCGLSDSANLPVTSEINIASARLYNTIRIFQKQ